MRSIVDSQKAESSLPPAARNGNGEVLGAAVASGDDSTARAGILSLGTWTDGAHVFKLQERDGADAFTDLVVDAVADPDAVLDSGLAGTDVAIITVDDATRDDTVLELDILSIKEDTRWVVTDSGSTVGLVAGAQITTGAAGGIRFAGNTNPMSPAGQTPVTP